MVIFQSTDACGRVYTFTRETDAAFFTRIVKGPWLSEIVYLIPPTSEIC